MDFSIFGNIDIAQLSFVGLATLGAVNAVTFFKKDLDSKQKFGISVVVALVLGFVPANIGVLLADKVKDAVTVALAVSGAYKVTQKIGGE